MEVKLGRNTFKLTDKDRILDNGVCTILITRTVFRNFGNYYPTVPKTTFAKLLKSGKVVKSDEKSSYGTLYKIVET